MNWSWLLTGVALGILAAGVALIFFDPARHPRISATVVAVLVVALVIVLVVRGG